MPEIFIGSLEFDIDPPVVDAFFPANGAAGVLVGTSISFSVTDSGLGVDLSSIDVDINAIPILANGVFAPGVIGTIAPIPNGYAVGFTPASPLPYNQPITVNYYVQDLAAIFNITTGSWSFSTEQDTTGPVISGQSPAASSTGIAVSSPVSFQAVDPETGVLLSSVNLTINGSPAVTSGSVQSGFAGSVTSIPGGWIVSATPTTPFTSFSTVSVLASASNDTTPSIQTTSSWSFQCADVDAPTITIGSPSSGASGVPVTTSISFTLNDDVGIDNTSINVSVDDVSAIIMGVFQPGFSGTISPPGTSVTVSITPAVPFASFQAVAVDVVAQDNASNTSTLSWSFQCLDTVAPVLDQPLPADGSVDVPHNSAIYFRVLDAQSGVNTSSIDVFLNSVQVVTDGVYASGYFGSIDPIPGGVEVHVHQVASFSSYEVVAISAYAEDNTGNSDTIAWSFRTLDDVLPSVSNLDPPSGATDVSLSASVGFQVQDTHSGVDPTSIEMTVGGSPAIVGGFVQSGFTGTIAPIVNGFDVSVTPVSPYIPASVVNVGIGVSDNSSNTTTVSWAFTTESNFLRSYAMRAINTVTLSYVWWTVPGAPDYTGSQSGVDPANLTDIVVERLICDETSTLRYTMQATNLMTLQTVWWTANYPDFAGTLSGINPVNLTGIALASASC